MAFVLQSDLQEANWRRRGSFDGGKTIPFVILHVSGPGGNAGLWANWPFSDTATSPPNF
jgi:hypothetical protein